MACKLVSANATMDKWVELDLGWKRSFGDQQKDVGLAKVMLVALSWKAVNEYRSGHRKIQAMSGMRSAKHEGWEGP